MRRTPRGGVRAPKARGPHRLAGLAGRCALVLGLLVGAAGCAGGPSDERVTILVPWENGEFRAFYSVIKEFEGDTGIHVDMEYTRAQTQQLDAVIAAGAPPDLAVLPSPAALYKYAGPGSDKPLRALDASLTEGYLEPFRSLAAVGGAVYAVPLKADVKSLNWYNPSLTAKPEPSPTAVPGDTTDKLAATWCLGLSSGPTSGWPGADWITDILLTGATGVTDTNDATGVTDTTGVTRATDTTDVTDTIGATDEAGGSAERGMDAYLGLLTGHLRWQDTAPAWEQWREAVSGSVKNASGRKYSDLYKKMTGDAPDCSKAHGALSALGFPAYKRVSDRPYDFEPSAGRGGPLQVSADFVGLFTDNPAAKTLLTHLAAPESQRSWANKPGGYALSANGAVVGADYTTNPMQRSIAAMLSPGAGHPLCFSAADVMEPDVSAAFYRAVLDYVSKPDSLPDLLAGLDEIQKDRGSSPVPQDRLCTGRQDGTSTADEHPMS